MVSTQKRNSELVDILRPDFQARYEPNFAWGNIASGILLMQGLRGFWPMSSIDGAGDCTDISGQGRTLTNNSTLFDLSGLIPNAFFNGTAGRLSRADEAGLDIIGTEAYIAADKRGFCMGGWFRPNSVAGTTYLMSKRAAAGQISYYLRITAGVFQFVVSVDGTALTAVPSTIAPAISTWYYVDCRFNPSTSLDIYVNGTLDQQLVAVPASIFNSNAAFQISGYSGATALYSGRASLCYLGAAYQTQLMPPVIFSASRAMFGV